MEAVAEKVSIAKYAAYKKTGINWLDEIPIHWEIVRSRRLFQVRKERARQDDQQLTASQKYGIISQTKFMELEGRRVTQVELNNDILKHVEANDFVISMRSFQGGIEYSFESGCVSSAYVPLIPIKHVVPPFFRYLLKSDSYIKALSSTSNLVRDGQALRFDNFSQVDLVIVPEKEQIDIANFLDRKTAQIDKAIAQKERQIELLKERGQILIHRAVTRGLNPDVQMKDSGVVWIGEVPEHWEVLSMNYVFKAVADIDHYMPVTRATGVPYVMTGDLQEFASDIDFDNCKKVSQRDYCNLSRRIKSSMGDVILARYATIGTASYVDIHFDFLVSYSCVTIKPSPAKLLGLYLFYYLKSSAFTIDIKNRTNTNTQDNVGIGDLKRVKIVLPPVDEQLEIVQKLQKEKDTLNSLIAMQNQQIEKLKEYKSTLIDAAVTGKIKVH